KQHSLSHVAQSWPFTVRPPSSWSRSVGETGCRCRFRSSCLGTYASTLHRSCRSRLSNRAIPKKSSNGTLLWVNLTILLHTEKNGVLALRDDANSYLTETYPIERWFGFTCCRILHFIPASVRQRLKERARRGVKRLGSLTIV